MGEDFVITASWIEAHRTQAGGWKRHQLAQIGVPWPPQKGWKDRAVGRVISAEARRVFEAFAEKMAGTS